MSDQRLPVIDQLADAENHTERAAWLLSCPLAILVAHEGAIRAVMRQAGFRFGVLYLEDICTVSRATRADGAWSEAAGEILEYANEKMRAVIAAEDGGAHADG